MTDLTRERVRRIEKQITARKRRRSRCVTVVLSMICLCSVCGIAAVFASVGSPGVSMVFDGYSTVLLRDGAGAYVVTGIAAFALGVLCTVLCSRYRAKKGDGRDPE